MHKKNWGFLLACGLIVFTLFFGVSLNISAQTASSLWMVETDSIVKSSPVIDEDGVVYFGDSEGILYAVNGDGSIEWEVDLGGEIKTQPVLDEEAIYVTSNNGRINAVNYSGEIMWSHTVREGIRMGDPIITEDRVYAGSDYRITALTKDGSEEWSFDVGNYNFIRNEIDVDSEGQVYVAGNDGILYALDDQGEVVWEEEIDYGNYLNGVRVSEEGMIYTGSDDGVFKAVNKEGETQWTFNVPSKIMMTSPLLNEGKIYFGTSERIYCLDDQGSEVWNYKFEGRNYIRTELAAGNEGEIYFGSSAGELISLSDGENKTVDYEVDSKINSTPLISEDGSIIYFGTENGNFYAVEK